MEKLPPLSQERIEFVDATPDDQYPLRILYIYLENTKQRWITDGLDESSTFFYELLNKHQRMRADILKAAIEKLEAK